MRFLFAAAFAASVLALSVDASAFCRQTTNQSFSPTAAKPCDDVGKPLAWASKCIGFSVQNEGSTRVPLDDARRLSANAYGAWTNADCTPCGAAGKPSMTIRDLGPVACDKVEYNSKVGNANIVVFRDANWPHAANELALTTLVFNTETGEIFDGDMEVNGLSLSITDPPQADGYDLPSILTHEAGHFYGLSHTQPTNTTATMFSKYQPGQTFMRDLTQDDVCGMCAAYPPSRAAQCNDTPRGGFASECGSKQPAQAEGCSCTAAGAPGTTKYGALALVLCALVAAARRFSREKSSVTEGD
jgi:hypothetical protein